MYMMVGSLNLLEMDTSTKQWHMKIGFILAIMETDVSHQ